MSSIDLWWHILLSWCILIRNRNRCNVYSRSLNWCWLKEIKSKITTFCCLRSRSFRRFHHFESLWRFDESLGRIHSINVYWRRRHHLNRFINISRILTYLNLSRSTESHLLSSWRRLYIIKLSGGSNRKRRWFMQISERILMLLLLVIHLSSIIIMHSIRNAHWICVWWLRWLCSSSSFYLLLHKGIVFGI